MQKPLQELAAAEVSRGGDGGAVFRFYGISEVQKEDDAAGGVTWEEGGKAGNTHARAHTQSVNHSHGKISIEHRNAHTHSHMLLEIAEERGFQAADLVHLANMACEIASSRSTGSPVVLKVAEGGGWGGGGRDAQSSRDKRQGHFSICTQFTCFSGTKVQLLTQLARDTVRASMKGVGKGGVQLIQGWGVGGHALLGGGQEGINGEG
jgi:hypothetical protein